MNISIFKIKAALFVLLFKGCTNKDNEYKIQLDSNCYLVIKSGVHLDQKSDTAYSDYTSLKNIINVFSNKKDPSQLKIIFNQFGYDSTRIHNLTDLAKELEEYKVNSLPNTKVLETDSIIVNGGTFLRIKYDIKQFGLVNIYSTVKKGKIVNFEFISNKVENSFFLNNETEILNHLTFNCSNFK